MIHPWQVQPKLQKYSINYNVPNITIVIPVYNQDAIIVNTLISICEMTASNFDLIIIDDASNDNTQVAILNFIKNIAENYRNLNSIVLLSNELPIYETACDNQGFKLAQTEFIIEIQADIAIAEPAYDLKMIAVANNSSVGTVSGRHIHQYTILDTNFSWIKYPFDRIKLWLDPYYGAVGLIGNLIFDGIPVNVKDNSFYLGETNARGPWLVRKSHLVEMNYLDEDNFFLGNDDHDLNRRLHFIKNKNAAYIPIKQICIAQNGSSRKIREGVNKMIYDYLSSKKTGSYEFHKFIKEYRPFLKPCRYNYPQTIV